ncbi:hypothetical protein FOS14_20200 [Skermania sp. ID1734]|uniref:B-4DMT family transporter n=1 Tax=Skermania sp. ID1734 TaxID=2597516 RepID=UPI00117D5071|nr:B-4DMT family transporter [Skermania sp. ID1734]TSD94632.1 hypothetical protein FOS14_20200 [Skermania sp. ID1734]
MNLWLLRGLCLAAVHVVVRVIVGLLIIKWPLHGDVVRWVSLVVVLAIALIWGLFDGRRDRRANPEAEDGADLTMLWLKAGIVGALVAGIVCWILDLVGIDVSSNGLFFEITSGAAWTTLIIFVPAMLGVAIGRLLANREISKSEQQRELVGAGARHSSTAGYQGDEYYDAPSGAHARPDEETTQEFPAVPADDRSARQATDTGKRRFPFGKSK